ncbi:DUF6559 family protein [Pseudoalteromonas sp. OF7H-1]|uniref:DUF6559 family protein n=1 Tax=Pseudoalteromonas sp. OF7H-1 TaxID=2917755 RepID=UPI001EF733A1|nr:DUF6559 family protein [Pseudoalteromonas sp. OF7H-1]MCG7539874.1 hypothetical protein [Pseudoalteromonas sp. OF7H-1]
MLRNFRRNQKIKAFAKNLPSELKKLYGRSEYYTKGQVDRALSHKFKKYSGGGVIVSDVCPAYAMFCTPKEFKEIHEAAGEACDYEELRKEITETCFDNATDFSFSSLESLSTSGGFFSSGGDSGGFGDGGGGGGD